MMGHRERLINGDEYDAFTDWRKVLCCLGRPGIVRKTKRRFWKRQRAEWRNRIAPQAALDGLADVARG